MTVNYFIHIISGILFWYYICLTKPWQSRVKTCHKTLKSCKNVPYLHYTVSPSLHTALSAWWKLSVGIKLGKPLWGEVLSSFQVHSSCTRCRSPCRGTIIDSANEMRKFGENWWSKIQNEIMRRTATVSDNLCPLHSAHEHGQSATSCLGPGAGLSN